MNNPRYLRKSLALGLMIVGAQCWQHPFRAQEKSKEQNPDRSSTVSNSPDSSRNQSADTSAQAGAPRLVVQLGHSGGVSALSMSADGRMVLTAGDTTARLWDVETGKEIRTFLGHSQMIASAAFSPDEQVILTAGDDDTARLWEAATGKEIKKFEDSFFGTKSAAFTTDGRMILTRGLNGARLLDAATGKEIRRFEAPEMNSVAISGDGKLVLTGGGTDGEPQSDRSVRLWDAATGKEIKRFVGHSSLIGAVALSLDGRLALTGSADKTARLWDTATGKERRRFTGHAYTVGAVAISPDSQMALTACSEEETAWLWDTSTGKKIREFVGHTYPVASVAFSPDGKTVLTGSSDNTARLWSVATGKEIKRLQGHSEPIMSARFLADNQITLIGHGNVAEVTDKTPWLWNTLSNEVVRFNGHSGHIPSAEVSADGQRLLTGSHDRTARLWDASTGKEIMRFVGHSDLVRATMSADGRVVLTGSNDKTARLWDASTGKETRRFVGHTDWVRDIILSTDGRIVATGGDTTARLWDASSGKEIRRFEHRNNQGHISRVDPVAISADGQKVLLSGAFRSIKLCDIATGAEITKFETETGVRRAALSPDGHVIMIWGDDRELRLWDAATGKEIKNASEEIRSLFGQAEYFGSIAFSPDGRFTLTAGEDRTARLRSATTGQELCRIAVFDDGTWVVVDTQGRFDTNNLDEIRGLHWILPDDPFKPQQVEIFLREYYEPRLLTRILAGEKFKPLKLLSELNRVQPKVSITSIQPELSSGTVTVTIDVSKGTGAVQRGGRKVSLETGAFDLRLFRDGQLVGYAPENGGEVKLNPATGRAIVKFAGIKLPRKADVKQVEFSAYAFNVEKVKSPTDRKSFDVPTQLAPVKGRAYLLTVGVNAYEQESFDLNFAANDARLVQKIVYDKLSKGGEYDEIVQIPLVSDYEMKDGRRIVTQNAATKNNLKSVLDLLAGKQVAPELIKDIPGADRINQARPEDLILISFSSHGFADDNGNFYFVPYDTGQVKEGRITDQLIKRCISSEELALWLRDVDAGEMVMIADACHSAATVDVEGFKPGPMGSRGLGQLAYDKRMRILTSTQADDVALESGLIKQGLLTYALTHDGIEAGQADFKPKDKTITLAEWLEYGVSRVPGLYEEVKRGELQSFGQGAEKRGLVHSAGKKSSDTSSGSSAKKKGYQQPSLFDFSRRKHDIALVKGN